MKKQLLSLSILTALSIAFVGCGSSDSPSEETITGQFIDSEVEGLRYVCSSGAEDITNQKGEFTCTSGDTVTFFLDSFELGTATAMKVITPNTLYPNDEEIATNIAQLLQTLDTDGDLENGIQVNPDMVEAIQEEIISLSAVDFDSVIASYIGMQLVSEEEALAHMNSVELPEIVDDNSGDLSTLNVSSYEYIYIYKNISDLAISLASSWDGYSEIANSTVSCLGLDSKFIYTSEASQDGATVVSYYDSSSTAGCMEIDYSGTEYSGNSTLVQAQ